LFLTAVYALFGPNPLVARIIQAVAVGILMPWLVFQLATVLFAPDAPLARPTKLLANGEKVGLAAAGITAVYAYFVYYSAALMTESFYITAILWFFLLAIRMSQSARITWWHWLLFGFALGVTILLRQVFLMFTPFLLLWLWFSARPNPLKFAIPLLVVAIMILPWTIRNYLAFDYFVLLNTNSGYAFYWGNHPTYGTKFIPILPSGEYFRLLPPELLHLNEAELDTALMDLAVENVLADPVRYILLSLSRIPPYFQFWPSTESEPISNVARVGSFGLFLPFMVYGLFYVLRLRFTSFVAFIRSPFALVFLFMLVYTGLHLLTWALVRYRLPVDALLILFAGVSVWLLAENGRKPRPIHHP
jgi:4-amino-4-deoxy-L-arabinose transferase-like glycosyltransferase